MSYTSPVRLVPLLRRLLDLQVANETKDREKREELEALGWPPWETDQEVGSTRRRTPWDYVAELVFAEFHANGKRFAKEELREHLLLRRLAGILLHAPLPTDGKTGREFQAALPTIPLGGVEEVSDLSAELARLDSEGLGNRLLEQLRRTFGERWANLAEILAPHVLGKGVGPDQTAGKKPKRSTAKGDARTRIIAALSKHHKYADGSCLNFEPIGNNELAHLAGVSESTVSEFFKKKFQGHTKYLATCRDKSGLLASALKMLNNEYAPYLLYDQRLAHEGGRDEE